MKLDAQQKDILYEAAGDVATMLVDLSQQYMNAGEFVGRATAQARINLLHDICEKIHKVIGAECDAFECDRVASHAEALVDEIVAKRERMEQAFERAMFISHGGNA